MTSAAVRVHQPGTYSYLVDLAVDEPVRAAQICWPANLWGRPFSTAALRLGRRALGRRRLTDRVPLGMGKFGVLAVTESRVMVWEARIGELVSEIGSWRHAELTLERKRHEIVSSRTDSGGNTTTNRTKVLRYRIATPEGELHVDVPAGRGPAAELDRALRAALASR